MNKKEKIKILQDVVKIKSVNGNETQVANYLAKLLKDHGIKASKVNGGDTKRSNLVASVSFGEGNILALSGHMDTVDVDDAEDWDYPPFDAEIHANKLYGRGSSDMKGGLCALVIAMIELKEKNPQLNGEVRLLATVGEEVGEIGAAYLTKQGYVDDIDGMIVAEPTEYKPMYMHKGSINYTVTSKGKAAHSSMPSLGNNAIVHLNDFITHVDKEMDKLDKRYDHGTLGHTTHAVTVIEGGHQVNSIPSSASLQGNIRSIPEFSNEKVIKKLQSIVDKLNKKKDCHLKLEIDYNKLPVSTDKNSDLIQLIKKVCSKKKFGKRLKLVGAPATTDMAEFIKSKNKFDFIIFGPGITKLAHQKNEYIEVDNYLEMIDIYKDICSEYLKKVTE